MKSPLLWAGILAIIALTTALIAPFFIDWNLYRDQIEAYGSEVTGRPVTIGGSISLRLLPAPVIVVHDISVSSEGEGTVPDLVKIKLLEADLSIPALLRGQFMVSDAVMTEPQLTFERTEAGKLILPFSERSRLDAQMAADDVSLDRVQIKNGTIFFNDWRRDSAVQIDDVQMELSASSLLGPYRVTGTAAYDAQIWRIAIGTSRPRPAGQVAFTVRAGPDQGQGPIYSVNGEIDSEASDDPLDAALSVERPVPPSGALSDQATKGDKGPEHPPFTLRADMKGDFERLDFSEIEISFGDRNDVARTIKGQAQITLARQPSLSATLETSRFALSSVVDRSRLVPTRQSIRAGLSQLVDDLPKALSVSLGFKATFLELPGSTVENFFLIADLDRNGIEIKRLSGTAPGRTKLTVEAAYGRAGESLEGRFAMETPDVGAAARWLDLREDLFAADGAPTSVALRGGFDLDRENLALTDMMFRIDDAEGTATISVGEGDRRQWQIRVAADQIDLDPLLGPHLLTPDQDFVPRLSERISSLKREWLERTDATLFLQVDRLRHRGVEARDVAVDIRLEEDILDVKALDIGNIGGASVGLSGRIDGLTEKPQGVLKARIDAQNPVPFFTMVGLVGAEPAAFADRTLRKLGPLYLVADLEARPERDETAVAMTIDGTVGTTALKAAAKFQGTVENFSMAAVTLDGRLANPNAEAFVAQFPWNLPALPKNSGPASVTLESRQAPSGMASELTIEMIGTQARATALFDDRPGISGHFNINSAQPEFLLPLLGLDVHADIGALSLEASYAHRDDVLSFTDIAGGLGSETAEGSLSFSWEPVRAVKGELEVSSLSIPWLLQSALLGQPEEADDPLLAELRDTDWSGTPFAVERLENLETELSIVANWARLIDATTVDDLRFKVRSGGGKFAISDASARWFSAPVKLTLEAEQALNELKMAGQIGISRLPLASLLQTSGGDSAMEGLFDLSADFSSSGRSPAGLIASLSGEGNYALRDAAVLGFDPEAFSRIFPTVGTVDQLEEAIAGSLQAGQMRFPGGESALKIEAGIVRLDPIAVTTPAAQGSVRSFFDLSSGLLDSAFDLDLTTIETKPGLEVSLSGPISALARAYETSALRSDLTVRVLRENIEKLEELQREQDRIAREEEERRQTEARRREEAVRAAAEEQRRAEERERQAETDRKAEIERKEEAARKAAAEARRVEDERQAEIARKAAQEQARREAEERARQEASTTRDRGKRPVNVVPPTVEVSPISPPDDTWMERPIPPDPVELGKRPRPPAPPAKSESRAPVRIAPKKPATTGSVAPSRPKAQRQTGTVDDGQGFSDPNRFTYSPR